MSTSLYGVIGTRTYGNILADHTGADRIAIPCEPGSGKLTAGVVMYRKATGLWAPAASANVIATNMLAVLYEEVDTGAAPGSGKTAVAVDALAMRAGTFKNGAVTLAAGAALTDAHKVILRGQNIVFDQPETTSTFTNTTTGT